MSRVASLTILAGVFLIMCAGVIIFVWRCIRCHKSRITTIITTSPYKKMDFKNHLYKTVDSLRKIPELYRSPVIIGFDGSDLNPKREVDPRCAHPTDVAQYEAYKDEVKRTVRNLLPNVIFVEAPERLCLTGNIRQCMDRVETKYVNIMQHDMPITKRFPLDKIINLLESDPEKFKLVRYACYMPNHGHEEWTRAMTHASLTHSTLRFQGQTFSRCNQWSDNNHITTRDYYEKIVFPITLSKNSFMEHELIFHPVNKHNVYGTYYLGDYDDGPYCSHTDGRNA